jgi:CubicO group peptidase (beta-lactamase class C family)
LPGYWQDITLHHLLTHTSGIPSFTDFPDYRESRSFPSLPARTLERFIDEPLDFQPGEGWYYSNSGYIVLGLVIEAVSGDPYRTFLRENIFEPLGMADTDYDSNTRIIEHHAEGYVNSSQKADYINMSIPYAAGGLYSTVEDLYRWDQALYQGEVVSQESWDAMLEAAVPIPDDPAGFSYGYGLAIGTAADHPSIGHGGGIEGFVTDTLHLTEENATIIVLSNFEQAQPWLITETIIKILFGEE